MFALESCYHNCPGVDKELFLLLYQYFPLQKCKGFMKDRPVVSSHMKTTMQESSGSVDVDAPEMPSSLTASSSSGSGGVERGKGYEQAAALAL